MKQLIPDNLTFTDVALLPIDKQFAKRINLVETINTMVESQMQLPPGQTVLAIVLDTLSGRTPLYRRVKMGFIGPLPARFLGTTTIREIH